MSVDCVFPTSWNEIYADEMVVKILRRRWLEVILTHQRRKA